MGYVNNVRRTALIGSLLLLVFLNQPTPAYASGVLVVGDRDRYHRHGEYREVVVSGNRYYYNQGIFYTGSPGNYVVTEAPVGAVVYEAPVGYEVVYIDGAKYYKRNNVYYKPHFGGGYEVTRMREHRDEDRHRGNGHDRDRR